MKDNICTVSYFPGRAEDAYNVRQEIIGMDGVVAVDLPDGLEDEIIKAVKILPKISVIVDDLGRAIPIIPTEPSVEAVRTALENNLEIEFLDVSLPFPREDFRGVDRFAPMVKDMGIKAYANLLHRFQSRYIKLRCKYMALKLKELYEKNEDLVLVCNINYIEDVLNYIDQSLGLGYTMNVSTTTCHVKEADVGKISSELPFLMFHYEKSRLEGFDREEVLLDLYADNEVDLQMINTYKYARNLALSDGRIYPDLHNLITAAKYTVGDDYASRILERSQVYPFTYEESNCVIKSYLDYDLKPLEILSVLKIKNKLSLGSEYPKTPNRNSPSMSFDYFKRFPLYKKTEKIFVNYLRNNYFHLVNSGEFEVDEFQCGLGDGIDIRQSLRYRFMDKIFVKNEQMINNTSYIIDFGGEADSTIFFDTQYNGLGTASSYPQNDGFCWNCLLLLPDFLNVEVSSLLYRINCFQAMHSCLDVAIQYSDFVYVFTNSEVTSTLPTHVKILPLDKIPQNLLNQMRCFDIEWL